ncbi:MAG: hypothetical protein N2C14_30265, partial [Planctomycetales bacterium]
WMLKGWVRSWNRPPCFLDNVPRLAELGRGSPTGAVVYRHRMFPDRYRGAMFSCCWSLGRIYALQVKPEADSSVAQSEIFLEAVGGSGFAPVDMAVGPQGEMYVAIGGRGTRGGVYRIEYGDKRPTADSSSNDDASRGDSSSGDDVLLGEVLTADQPMASWSRAKWTPKARKLGRDVFARAAAKGDLPDRQRVRALEILTELFGGVPGETADKLAETGNAAVKARLAWSLGRSANSSVKHPAALLARMTHDADHRVKRQAWEALLDLPDLNGVEEAADWSDAREQRPRRVRAAAIAVLARIDEVRAGTTGDTPHGELADLWRNEFREQRRPTSALSALDLFVEAKSPSLKLEAVRLMQLSLGDTRVEF